MQQLAGVGAELRGKKIVISLSSRWFSEGIADHKYYVGNFSRLHAEELAFSTDVNLALKQAAARKMLLYPETLLDEPLLRFALERLAAGSHFDLLQYYLGLPLGNLQVLAFHLQDEWEILTFIQQQRDLDLNIPYQPAELDWSTLLTQAESVYKQHTTNNLLGIEDTYWSGAAATLLSLKGQRSDNGFNGTMERSGEWADFDLLLRELKELGARPLIIINPINGAFCDWWGVSAKARQAYCARVRAVTKRYNMIELVFQDHDEDRFFGWDSTGHLSPKGWVYYDQALDAFYHNALP